MTIRLVIKIIKDLKNKFQSNLYSVHCIIYSLILYKI